MEGNAKFMAGLPPGEPGVVQEPQVPLPPAVRPHLNCIREARLAVSMSRRDFARRLDVDRSILSAAEEPEADLYLSFIQRCAEVLRVRADALVVEQLDAFKGLKIAIGPGRALMKKALAIYDASTELPIRRLAQMFCEQLAELCPELAPFVPPAPAIRPAVSPELLALFGIPDEAADDERVEDEDDGDFADET